MSDFKFLEKYVFDTSKGVNNELTKHTLIKLKEVDYLNIIEFIDIPTELREFWKQIGF
jgi:hypothetical protein